MRARGESSEQRFRMMRSKRKNRPYTSDPELLQYVDRVAQVIASNERVPIEALLGIKRGGPREYIGPRRTLAMILHSTILLVPGSGNKPYAIYPDGIPPGVCDSPGRLSPQLRQRRPAGSSVICRLIRASTHSQVSVWLSTWREQTGRQNMSLHEYLRLKMQEKGEAIDIVQLDRTGRIGTTIDVVQAYRQLSERQDAS